MTTHPRTARSSSPTTAPAAGHGSLRLGRALVGGVVFLIVYLSVGFVQGALADRDLPLPDDPASEAAAYYAANPAATFAVAGLQAISIVGLALFVASVIPVLRNRGGEQPRALRVAAVISVAAMLVSSAISVVLALVASDSSDATVGLLRQASFYAGGVVSVVALGVFVLGAVRVLGATDSIGRPTRWLGYIAGTLACLSALSVVFYYANAFLPLGRVLGMVWTVAAAISLLRRARHGGARATLS